MIGPYPLWIKNKMPRIKESVITVLPMNINFHILVKLPRYPKRETSHKTYKILRRKKWQRDNLDHSTTIKSMLVSSVAD
jgi:hypothetical protein